MIRFPSLLKGLSDETLKDLRLSSIEYANLHGILKYTPALQLATLQHTLLPSPFPSKSFQLAMSLQKDFNILYQKVAADHNFLVTTLKPALAHDPYLASLWRLYDIEQTLGSVQKIKLSLSRSDYMLHLSNDSPQDMVSRHLAECVMLKQVEYNLIASSFGGIMERLVRQHQLTLSVLGHDSDNQLPSCPSATGFGRAIVRAVEEYCKLLQSLALSIDKQPAVLVVISPQETNVFDQRSVELAVLQLNPTIKFLRRTFDDLSKVSKRVRCDENHRLFVDGVEIALVYYRTGYSPDQFRDEEDWVTKGMLERTLAIKCPSIDYLLANTKLVQTALAQPNVLKRFFGDEKDRIDNLTSTFAHQSFLSTDFEFASKSEIDAIVSDCMQNPSNYVLKPQREGGGNNIFGDAICAKLRNILGKPEANTFILMQRLQPPLVENCVVGLNYPPPIRRSMVCELGIYGVLLSNGDDIIENYSSGHLLRSKFFGVDEGGVAAGFACLDTPYLV
uniref:Glutathione synthetase n=3 Tax=Schistocephalus solidus TaxID=70667 RepID=A0A0V0J8S9_SCHSO